MHTLVTFKLFLLKFLKCVKPRSDIKFYHLVMVTLWFLLQYINFSSIKNKLTIEFKRMEMDSTKLYPRKLMV